MNRILRTRARGSVTQGLGQANNQPTDGPTRDTDRDLDLDRTRTGTRTRTSNLNWDRTSDLELGPRLGPRTDFDLDLDLERTSDSDLESDLDLLDLDLGLGHRHPTTNRQRDPTTHSDSEVLGHDSFGDDNQPA
jgi:hypothetical protein